MTALRVQAGDLSLEVELVRDSAQHEVWLNHAGPFSGFIVGLGPSVDAALLDAHQALGQAREALLRLLLEQRAPTADA